MGFSNDKLCRYHTNEKVPHISDSQITLWDSYQDEIAELDSAIQENALDISHKLDKVTTTTSSAQVYTKMSTGVQSMTNLRHDAQPWAVVYYDGNGKFEVEAGTQGKECVNYEQLEPKLDKTEASDLYMLKNNGVGSGTTTLNDLNVDGTFKANSTVRLTNGGHVLLRTMQVVEGGEPYHAIVLGNNTQPEQLRLQLTVVPNNKLKILTNNSTIAEVTPDKFTIKADFVCEGTTQVPEVPTTDTSIASKKYVDTRIQELEARLEALENPV